MFIYNDNDIILTISDIALDTSIEMDGIDKIIKKLNAHIIHQRSSDMSIYAELYSSKITENSMNFDYQHVYNNKPAKSNLLIHLFIN